MRMSQPKTQSRDIVTNTLWVWLRFLKRFKPSGNGSINQVKIWVIVNEGSWDPFSHTSTWCTWSELLIQKLVLQMRIHLPLLQASKNVLLIKVTHQAPFCSCCRERKGERDTYKGPFFPLFLDRCLKRDWWVRWLPSLCWCSNRQLLRIWAKYRLNLIEFSSTVALSNLWTVSQAWTMSQALEAGWHLCWSCTKSLLLGIGHWVPQASLQRELAPSVRVSGTSTSAYLTLFRLLRSDSEEGHVPVPWCRSWGTSLCLLLSLGVFLFYSHLPTLHTWLMLNTAHPSGNVTFIFSREMVLQS